MRQIAPSRPLRSFWMGGFEGADHINCHGTPLDMNTLSGHVELLDADYARLGALGLAGVRESVGWRIASLQPAPGQHYDFTRLRRTAATAQRHGVQVLWTLMHYGMPEDVTVTAPDFPQRFAEFAGLAAREIRRISGAPSVYTPINEIGFLAWAYTQTHLIGSRRGGDAAALCGYETKCRLVAAALAGAEAVRQEDPGALLLQVEPLIHVSAAPDRPDLIEAAATFTAYQWQAWDLLLGRLEPQLGGHAGAIDLIGINHYHDAQWQLPSGAPLPWNPLHADRRPVADLLEEAAARYPLPIVIAETSCVGIHRADWLNMITAETLEAMRRGVPIEGVCLYPIVDRPDWNNGAHWHNSGLWDAGEGTDARLLRTLAGAYACELGNSQARCAPHLGRQQTSL